MISTRSSLVRALAALGLVAGLGAAATACSAPATTDGTTASSSSSASATAGAADGDAVLTYDDEDQLLSMSYPGEDGRTALELLLEHDPSATVEGEGEMAFVTGIGGRAADPTSEFWSLDVDGQFAEVGAGSLETKDGETITWTLTAFE
ncbi:MAG: DUF4430 domain-containing protein [Salana multivorans]|uniref:DUF4430 domain-containing protein n=1 Tax=Salana multivorans TaxID=120377 RepID=UPI000969FB00|nr:DUF4430 domain-containing protein [Salana multivorans]MBN8881696.1 DUF4430 domain-containing protein [Salana multivorans]OJX98041.1 MAG: hypothetical protein BGO96_14295 [Micrococcales bacterium 73-15]